MTLSLRKLIYCIFVLMLVSLAFLRQSSATEIPINIRVINFGGSNFWQATDSHMVPTSDGRYKTEKITSAQASRKCTDFLAGFQKRPLTVMKENGYITESTFLALNEKLKDDLDARQLLLVSLYSDITVAQAKDLFGDVGVPKSRILKEFDDPVMGKIIRVSRGTIHAVRGHIIGSDSAGKPTLDPKKIPWGLDNPLASGLERDFDRSKIKALVEIGRAHSESGPLPGNLKLAFHTLVTTLQSEFHFLKVDLNQVLLTAHFLDPQHVRFFTKAFPLRPLDAATQQALEDDLDGTLANYLHIKLPQVRSEWNKLKDTVTFGSLAQAVKDFPASEISETAYQMARSSHGKLTGEQALHLVAEFMGFLRDDYDYVFNNIKSKKPLMIRDLGSSTAALMMQKLTSQYGFQIQDPDYSGVKTWLETMNKNSEPDAFSEAWNDRSCFVGG